MAKKTIDLCLEAAPLRRLESFLGDFGNIDFSPFKVVENNVDQFLHTH